MQRIPLGPGRFGCGARESLTRQRGRQASLQRARALGQRRGQRLLRLQGRLRGGRPLLQARARRLCLPARPHGEPSAKDGRNERASVGR